MNISEYRYCGFRNIAACAPTLRPADINYNMTQIENMIEANAGADIILFPELAVTGYTCADLFGQNLLLDQAYQALIDLSYFLTYEGIDSVVAVGAPIIYNDKLYNCAVLYASGRIFAIVPKTYIPNYGEYYEQRWFASGADVDTFINLKKTINAKEAQSSGTYILSEAPNQPDADFKNVYFGTKAVLDVNGMRIGAEICEDLWVPIPPHHAWRWPERKSF